MRNRVVAFAPGGNLLVQFERPLDPGEQFLVVERFFNKVAGAALQGSDRHRHIAMAGHENDRELRAERVESFMQLQAAHFRHPHIQHQAAAHIVAAGVQETLGGIEAGHLVTFAFEQPGHRIAHGFVVINDKNGLCHLIPPFLQSAR